MIRGWDETTAAVTRASPSAPAEVCFFARGAEVLRISRDGFFVEGEAVAQDGKQARKVHMAFVKWLRSQGMAV